MMQRLAGLIVVLVSGFAAVAQDSAASKDQAREARLAEVGRLAQQAETLQQAGRLAEAVGILEAVLAIEREVFGQIHDDVADTLSWIASLEKSRNNLTTARDALDKALAIRKQLHGPVCPLRVSVRAPGRNRC
jgi:tetratricopeptide (TPR) repeat protein